MSLQEITSGFPPVIQRKDIGRLTFGLLNPKTQANKDSKGTGISNPFTFRGRVCYLREAVIDYLNRNVGQRLPKWDDPGNTPAYPSRKKLPSPPTVESPTPDAASEE
jgi:hypothetical protein